MRRVRPWAAEKPMFKVHDFTLYPGFTFLSHGKDANQARMEPTHERDPFHVMGGRGV